MVTRRPDHGAVTPPSRAACRDRWRCRRRCRHAVACLPSPVCATAERRCNSPQPGDCAYPGRAVRSACHIGRAGVSRECRQFRSRRAVLRTAHGEARRVCGALHSRRRETSPGRHQYDGIRSARGRRVRPVDLRRYPLMDTSIHARALLVCLRISTWSARKYDRPLSAKVNAQHAASSDASRVNKLLLPGDAKAYKAMIGVAGSIRTQHYANTLSWSDEGWRLLPTANYTAYTTWLRERQREFDAALHEFATDYPAMRAHAARLLNGMYRDEDYPSVQDIRSKFSLSVGYAPVPAQGDIRVDLGSDQIAIIETAIADRLQQATADAMRDAWTRLHDVVSKIAERLSQP